MIAHCSISHVAFALAGVQFQSYDPFSVSVRE
jgi:hypothetical protein